MRRFADLHLRPPLQNAEAIERMAHLAAEIGLYLVGVTFDSQVSKETRMRVTEPFEVHGLKTVSRIDLRPKSRKELLRSLRIVRGPFDIVAVECSNTQVGSLAFRDRRIDLVFFSPEQTHSRLGWLMPRRSRRPIEVNIADLLSYNLAPYDLQRSFNLVAEARRRGMPIVASSGASDQMAMRTPRDISAVLSVLDLGTAQALDSVSRIPFSLAHTALSRREPGFIVEGTKLVRTQP